MRKLSFIIAKIITKKTSQTHKNRFVYYYVLQFILSIFFETLIILGLSFLLGCLFETIVLLLVYIPLRQNTKGIHLESFFKCIITSAIFIVGLSYINKISSQNYIESFMCAIMFGWLLYEFLISEIGKKLLKWIDRI